MRNRDITVREYPQVSAAGFALHLMLLHIRALKGVLAAFGEEMTPLTVVL